MKIESGQLVQNGMFDEAELANVFKGKNVAEPWQKLIGGQFDLVVKWADGSQA